MTQRGPEGSLGDPKEHSNTTNLRGMQKAAAPGIPAGDTAWRRSPCKIWRRCSAPSRKLLHKWPPEAPWSWQPMRWSDIRAARQGPILQGVSHRDHLHNPTCQRLSRKGLTPPRASITDEETVSLTNGCRRAVIRLERSDMAVGVIDY
ncbi:hypothetical protein GOODEAATRI_032781 [Goodea atripinnis]|uniref:Uncharacterized protein n=1 Tax=Goodea atripinnis TaxID=208336 RepID=A0ABV0NFX9_9TELE